ncbi:hypothetical protein L6452_14122 [Arctium lappa]|uniref:Uncharacterized protein n=1 Tax=Arctium lappa TaxID=4217 RepID=A0ACB9CK09_ARCLA|nr:hypothetical protein L6452_14122 [Arctium lappa]
MKPNLELTVPELGKNQNGKMLGFITFTRTHPISSILITNPFPKQQSRFPSIQIDNISCLKSRRKKLRRFKASFSDDKEELSEKTTGDGGGGNEEEDLKKKGGDERPRFNLRWSELLFDPDPDNVVAVGLTGVLAWASVQVLWQLFVISFAILIAAVKYSFIAALLIFILITLL